MGVCKSLKRAALSHGLEQMQEDPAALEGISATLKELGVKAQLNTFLQQGGGGWAFPIHDSMELIAGRMPG